MIRRFWIGCAAVALIVFAPIGAYLLMGGVFDAVMRSTVAFSLGLMFFVGLCAAFIPESGM